MKKFKIFPLIISASFILGACVPTEPIGSSSGDLSSSEEIEYRELASFDLPRTIIAFNSAVDKREDSALINTGHEFSQNRFFITDNSSYKVGDDNPFVFLPNISAYVGDGLDEVTLKNYHSIAKVDIKESGNTWRELTGNERDTYVALDTTNSTFDFTEEAIGKNFKLRVLPDKEFYIIPSTVKELSFEVSVIDGYNVQTVAQLSMMDNFSPLWDEYKIAKGLSTDEKPKGIILHDDLKITPQDLPAGFFYTGTDIDKIFSQSEINAYQGPDGKNGRDALIGSLKDFVTIYTHDTLEDETFTFEGNFFSIDGKDIPLVRKFSGTDLNEVDGTRDSHASLFGLPGDGRGIMHEDTEVPIPAQPQTIQGEVVMRNFKAIGNGGRDNQGVGAGGVIFIKSGAKAGLWENIISINVFTAFVLRTWIGIDEAEEAGASLPVDHVNNFINYCKAFDSYSSMLYLYGSGNNFISNSVFKRAGGSLVICDEVFSVSNYVEGETVKRLSNLTTTNFEYASLVTGEEPWFKSHNASAQVAMFKAMGDLFVNPLTAGVNPTQKNIVQTVGTDQLINIVALLIRGDDVFTNNASELDSKISINEPAAPIDASYLMATPYGGIINSQEQFMTYQASTGPIAFFNGINDLNFLTSTGLEGVLATLQNPSPSSDNMAYINEFFAAETMNVYLKPAAGMKNVGIVLGFN